MEAAARGRQLLKGPRTRTEITEKVGDSQQESRQSCKTLKLVAKHVPSFYVEVEHCCRLQSLGKGKATKTVR
jgi:hypothetical protein